MSVLTDNKFLLGVAGAAASAAALGFLFGKKCGMSAPADPGSFIFKSFYDRGKGNPILKYMFENAVREAEPLRKLREVSLMCY